MSGSDLQTFFNTFKCNLLFAKSVLEKLIQKDESLGDYFAECIDDWTKHEKCRGIIKSVILEMINITDTTAQKGLVNLIQGLGWIFIREN